MGQRFLVARVLFLMFVTAGTAQAKLGGGDITFSVSGAADVTFSHDAHAGRAKINCKDCHYKLYTTRANHKTVTKTQMQQGLSCGACHNDTRAFSVTDPKHCSRCHNR
jgi:c(7)-type cytochrome triheme protein